MSTVYISLKIKTLNYSYVTLGCRMSRKVFRHHPDDDYPLICFCASRCNEENYQENCCSLNTRNAYEWNLKGLKFPRANCRSTKSTFVEASRKDSFKWDEKYACQRCTVIFYVTYLCTIIYVWERTWSTRNVQTGERMMQTETETMNE